MFRILNALAEAGSGTAGGEGNACTEAGKSRTFHGILRASEEEGLGDTRRNLPGSGLEAGDESIVKLNAVKKGAMRARSSPMSRRFS